MGPKTVKTGIFQKWSPTLWVKRTFLGHLGPVLTRLAQFLPGLETVMESNMGPKPVKNDFFQKWLQTLWEGQTDLSGPFGAGFDQFYGYTG